MKKDLVFVITVTLAVIILAIIDTGFENPQLTQNTIYEKAEILKTDNSALQEISVVVVGNQKVKIKLLSGKFKGQEFDAENILNGQKNIDKIFKTGDKVLAVVTLDNNGNVIGVRAAEFYRTGIELFLAILFVAALIGFAGVTGLKAVLSFMFTALSFWKILLPLYLKGISPIPAGIILSFVTSTVVILLVAGVNKKGFSALSGASLGIAFTALLSLVSAQWFKIPGTVQDYSEALIYSGFNLNLSQIFIASIFISASGALMDVSTDIAAAIDEIHRRMPQLPGKELVISGFKIARPVIGSMTTTLLFAYSSGFLFAFMAFMAKGMPLTMIINSNYIAAEIFHTLTGSLGLVLTAPLTAIAAGIIYSRGKLKIENGQLKIKN